MYDNKAVQYEIVKQPFFDSYGNLLGIVVTSSNVSYRYELERLRIEFFANLSHELRTPLNLIFSSLQTIEALESNLVNKNNKQIYFTFKALPINWQLYNDVYLAIVTDVTETKMRELALEVSEKKFKLALKQTSVDIWEFNIPNNAQIRIPYPLDMTIQEYEARIKKHFDLFTEEAKQKLYNARPGLSGIGSVVFRNEEEILQNFEDHMHRIKTRTKL